MLPVDSTIITIGIMMSVVLYSGLFIADHHRARVYVRENLGAPFIIAFIVLLVAAAIMFSLNYSHYANLFSEYAYLAILIGVILQVVSLRAGRRSNAFGDGASGSDNPE